MEIDTGSRRVVDPISFRDRTAHFIVMMNDTIKEKCGDLCVPVVDLFNDLKEKDKDILDPVFSIGDNAHLNLEGHKRISRSLMDGYFEGCEGLDTVVCLGDSHTQGFPVRSDISRNGVPIDTGMDSENQFPYWLAKSTGITVINRGIAGNTFYGMLNRFNKEVVRHLPDHCVIQGGTNDALLGTPFEESLKDLFTIVDLCIEDRITPVVCTVIPLGF